MTTKAPRTKTVTVARKKNRDLLALLRNSTGVSQPLNLTKKQSQLMYGENMDTPTGFADVHEKERLAKMVSNKVLGVLPTALVLV
eukprot:CFRG2544T1